MDMELRGLSLRGLRSVRWLTVLIWLLHIYCHMVRTPWDWDICIYGVSEQNV